MHLSKDYIVAVQAFGNDDYRIGHIHSNYVRKLTYIELNHVRRRHNKHA